MRKTSVTDPLIIESVTPKGTTGAIGMTLCPGRKGPSMAGGRWDRDLATDLEAVRVWNPDMVLSLLEDHEYALLGIPEFRSAVAKAGLPWEFLPILDGGVPDETFARAWNVVGPRVRDTLQAGGRVLVHCRAGLGRTGTIAAAILIELGAPAAEAMEAVRAGRPNRIERAQEAYVRARRLVAASSTRS